MILDIKNDSAHHCHFVDFLLKFLGYIFYGRVMHNTPTYSRHDAELKPILQAAGVGARPGGH